jgi:hypothetical protein
LLAGLDVLFARLHLGGLRLRFEALFALPQPTLTLAEALLDAQFFAQGAVPNARFLALSPPCNTPLPPLGSLDLVLQVLGLVGARPTGATGTASVARSTRSASAAKCSTEWTTPRACAADRLTQSAGASTGCGSVGLGARQVGGVQGRLADTGLNDSWTPVGDPAAHQVQQAAELRSNGHD